MKTTDIQFIVFAGGAARGVVYGSALDQLRIMTNYNFKTDLKGSAGTSIGAFFAASLCLDIPINTLLECTRTMNLSDVISMDFTNIFASWSVDSGDKLREWMRQFFGEWTFLEAYQKFGKILKIPVSELNTCSSIMFSHTTHPDMKVYQAVYMSMSIPFLVPPSSCGKQLFVDGGILNNFPIETFPAQHTLGLRVVWSQTGGITSMEGYVTRLMYCALETVTNNKLKHIDNMNIILINAGTVSGVNMRLGDDERNMLFMSGRNAMYKYIKKFNLEYITHSNTITVATQTDDDARLAT